MLDQTRHEFQASPRSRCPGIHQPWQHVTVCPSSGFLSIILALHRCRGVAYIRLRGPCAILLGRVAICAMLRASVPAWSWARACNMCSLACCGQASSVAPRRPRRSCRRSRARNTRASFTRQDLLARGHCPPCLPASLRAQEPLQGPVDRSSKSIARPLSVPPHQLPTDEPAPIPAGHRAGPQGLRLPSRQGREDGSLS